MKSCCYSNSYIYVVKRSAQVADFRTVAGFKALPSAVDSLCSIPEIFWQSVQLRDHKAPVTSTLKDIHSASKISVQILCSFYSSFRMSTQPHVNKRDAGTITS
jgi:hypothetical protein